MTRTYHHSVETWLRNNLPEIPERFHDLVKKFVLYCRRTGVKDVSTYTYLSKLKNFLKYLNEQDIGNIIEKILDLKYEILYAILR